VELSTRTSPLTGLGRALSGGKSRWHLDHLEAAGQHEAATGAPPAPAPLGVTAVARPQHQPPRWRAGGRRTD
jgi:hypothetical protein